MNEPAQRFWPLRRFVVVIEHANEHGIPIREEIARFIGHDDAKIFVDSYNKLSPVTRLYKAKICELRYADDWYN